jgi:hypothetical protein
MLVSFLSALIPQWIALDGGYTRWAKRDLNVGADFGDHAHGNRSVVAVGLREPPHRSRHHADGRSRPSCHSHLWLWFQRAWELIGEGRSVSSAAHGAGFPTPRTSPDLRAECSALRSSLSRSKSPNDPDTPRGRRWGLGYHLAGS